MADLDYGRRYTDERLADLERDIARLYGRAAEEMREKLAAHLERFAQKDEVMRTRLDGGEITETDYHHWRLGQMARGERYEAVCEELTRRMTDANRIAMAYVNGMTPEIYALNRNFGAYTIEAQDGDMRIGTSFTLMNEEAVRRLIAEQPELLPHYPEEKLVDVSRDQRWNRQHITGEITTGILLGESIPDIAKRMEHVVGMNRSAAVRNARTAVTGAQNAGALASYEAAEAMGIRLKKRWLSTLDGRTRHSHAALDGEIRAMDKVFSNGCRYPGDPEGKPEEVYNCRCTLLSVLDGFEDLPERAARDPVTGKTVLVKNMTYPEWEAMHLAEDPVSFRKYLQMTRNESADRRQYGGYRRLLGRNAPESFDKFRELKYNGDEWETFCDYAKSVEKEELSPLTDFDLYRETSRQIDELLVGLITADGTEITGKSKHFIARTIGSYTQQRNGVPLEDALEALTSPEEIREIRVGANGRSKKYLGKNCMVSVNPDTGLLIQDNPRSAKGVKS